MTLQQPKPSLDATRLAHRQTILCHKCGNPITFNNNHIAPNGRKIPLEPNTNGELHVNYCMYASSRDDPSVESLIFEFLSKVPNRRSKRVIGAVGRAK